MAQRGSGRWTKRKLIGKVEGDGSLGSKKPKSDLVQPKLPANGYPTEHPFNKDGFRYILAEPDPHAPHRQEFDDNQDLAGKPIPGWLFRKLSPENVLIAMHDRAPQLKVTDDRLTITGEKGYCMARATHGVNIGSYYYEVYINDMPDGAAVRIGWSQELGNLQGPCGYDKFSYAWRSRKGTAFHESKGRHFADSGFGQGDTVGFLISLPVEADHIKEQRQNSDAYLPSTHKDRPLIKFKNFFYFEDKDEVKKEQRLLTGSAMSCYKNGQPIGAMFKDFAAGIYYPAVSLYKSATVTFNFGPNFKHPPKDQQLPPFKPVSELAIDGTVQEALADTVFFAENFGKLRLDTFYNQNT